MKLDGHALKVGGLIESKVKMSGYETSQDASRTVHFCAINNFRMTVHFDSWNLCFVSKYAEIIQVDHLLRDEPSTFEQATVQMTAQFRPVIARLEI